MYHDKLTDRMDNATGNCRIEGCKYSGCAAEEGSGKFDDGFINVKVAQLVN